MLNLTVVQTAQGQQLNASFAQGDDVEWAFAGTVNGTPLNLTGASIRMTIGLPTPLVISTANGGIDITDPSQGQFQVSISSDTTAPLAPGTYPYDLWIESQQSPPVENQYVTGAVTINQSITVVP